MCSRVSMWGCSKWKTGDRYRIIPDMKYHITDESVVSIELFHISDPG